jgi:EAL domain-containing protein (putative c-di-GMP-specific phosphodiesterase class I)
VQHHLVAAQFLDLADTAELGGALGVRVLRQACHAAAAWARAIPAPAQVQVAVNLSGQQLLQPGTVGVVRDALALADCPPERLVLEIPEGALAADEDAAREALEGLAALGVQLALDDLGTDSSPLSYLGHFPLDLVKIDRSLVSGLGTDPEMGAVVASLVSLAQAMGVRSVAEGVETTDQLSVLRRLGCDLAQGYLFTRPMSLPAATDWLQRSLAPARAPRRAPAAVPQEALKRALELQAEGASLHTVAARLNAEGHRNAVGRRWHHTAVAQLIAAHRFPDMDV